MKNNNESLTKFDLFEKRIDKDEYFKNRALKNKMIRNSFFDLLKEIKIPNLEYREVKVVSSDAKTKVHFEVIKNPIDTFGIYHESWHIQCKKTFNGFFFIRFTDDELKVFKSDTITLFYYNDEIKNYEIIRNCIHEVKSNTFGFKISKIGTYSIIGIPNNYIEEKTINVLCEFRPLFKKLSRKNGIILKDKICQLVRCLPDDVQGFRNEMDNFLGSLGQRFPSDPCESCIDMPFDTIPDLPACQIPSFRRECNTSAWVNLGPFNVSGCIKQVKIVPNPTDENLKANKVYALSHNGGLWVIDESIINTKWEPLSDKLDNITMKAFDISNSDNRVIYVVNRFGVLYQSINSGENWRQKHNFSDNGFIRNRAGVKIQIHRYNSNILFLSCSSGFYKSSNGGVDWEQLSNQNISDFAIDFQDSSIIYLCIRGGGVSKSYDMGDNWNEILNFDAETNQPSFTEIKIALGSKNAGVEQNDENRTVAVLMGTEVIVSNDGGITWGNTVDLYPPNANGERGGHQTDWCYTIEIDPFDPQRIFAAHVDLRISEDGGQTWSDKIRPGHEDQQYICFDKNSQATVYIANDGGVFKSNNRGLQNTWTNLNQGLITAEFYRVGVHGNSAVGNMYHQGLRGTTDLSNRESMWVRANTKGRPNGSEFSDVYVDHKIEGRYYVMYQPPRDNTARFLRLRFPSTPSTHEDFIHFAPESSTFDPISFRLPYPSIIAIDKRTDSNVILCCIDNEGGSLMKTREGNNEVSLALVVGDHDYLDDSNVPNITNLPEWTNENLDNNNYLIICVAFSPKNNGIAYAMTKNGKFFKSNEVNSDVTTWTEQTGHSRINGIRQFAINYSDDNKIYAITENNIGISIDGGVNWNPISGNLPPSTYNTIVASPFDANTIYIGTDMGVFASFNDGEDWVVFDYDMPNVEVTQIFFEGGYLYAVTHGRGLWRKDICSFTRIVR